MVLRALAATTDRQCSVRRSPVADQGGWAQLLADAVAQVGGQPEQICRLCLDALAITGAGISMLTTSGRHEVVCATDDVAARLEDLQLELGEGPCVDAIRGGMPVLVDDLLERDDLAVERWPDFMAGARATRARALYAFPLRVGAVSLGALDLYRDQPGSLSAGELPAAVMAADAAAATLLTLRQSPAGDAVDEADPGPVWQMQVHQASGMVKIQLGVTIEEALLALRARAFSTGRSVADVATDVVERRLRFGRDDR